MSSLEISDLKPTISEFLPDSEIHPNDISKNEINSISGGGVDHRETFVCGSVALVSSVFFTPVVGAGVGLFCTLFAAEFD